MNSKIIPAAKVSPCALRVILPNDFIMVYNSRHIFSSNSNITNALKFLGIKLKNKK
jgi:hypothetical protein